MHNFWYHKTSCIQINETPESKMYRRNCYLVAHVTVLFVSVLCQICCLSSVCFILHSLLTALHILKQESYPIGAEKTYF
jgi:hypothetical protein